MIAQLVARGADVNAFDEANVHMDDMVRGHTDIRELHTRYTAPVQLLVTHHHIDGPRRAAHPVDLQLGHKVITGATPLMCAAIAGKAAAVKALLAAGADTTLRSKARTVEQTDSLPRALQLLRSLPNLPSTSDPLSVCRRCSVSRRWSAQ